MTPEKQQINSNPAHSQAANQNPVGANPVEEELNEEQLDEVAGGGFSHTPPVPDPAKSFPVDGTMTSRKEIW